MANSTPSLSDLDRIATSDFTFFADLCQTTAAEDNGFFLVCAVFGGLLSVLVCLLKNRFSQLADINVSLSGWIMPILTIVGVAVLAFLGTEQLFPAPRDSGNDCGFTPDSVFLPLAAGVIGPTAFVFVYWLMSTVLSRKHTKQ